MPPSQGVSLLPRMPALKTCTPAVPPLSFMKITSVSRSMPHSFSLREQPAHVVVDVGDHAEELRRVGAHLAGVALLVFLGHLQRARAARWA